jgi:hypothetical protein
MGGSWGSWGARLGSARLGSARLGSARLGSARLGSALRKTTFKGSDLAFPTEDEVFYLKPRLPYGRRGFLFETSPSLRKTRSGHERRAWRGRGWVVAGLRLGSARLGSARLGSARLGSTQDDVIWVRPRLPRSEKSDLASPTEDEVGKIRPHLHTEDEVLPTRSDHGRRGRGEVVPRNVVSCVVMPHNVTIPSQPQTTSWCN